jgi:DNA polymerase-3 subunit beta
VDGPAFAEAVAQVAVVAGRDEALPFLTGVRIELAGDVLRLVATDRYRLAVRELAWEPTAEVPAPEAVALVPAKSLYELARSLQKGERIALALTPDAAAAAPAAAGNGLIGFRAGARQATTRLLAGEFITYQRIFPAAYAGEAVVGRQALLDAVKRISLVAERHLPVLLALDPDRLVVRAGAGGEARGREELPARYSGAPVVLAANAAYLTEGLTVLGTPYARLGFTTPTKPAVLTPCQAPEESVESGGDAGPSAPYRYLFMPQRSTGRA